VTAQAKHIIDDFGALPDQEKREVLAELFRMSRELEYPSVSDDELLVTADEIFLEYDRREATE
jgi:hypothetical protein